MAERKSAKQNRKRASSASLERFSTDNRLDERKSCRETRTKPWKEEVVKIPKTSPVNQAVSKRAMAALNARILEDAWIEDRENEMWAINNRKEFKPVTVILVSSELQNSSSDEVLLILRESDNTLTLVYDYLTDTYEEIIKTIKSALEVYGAGVKAEKLVIICHGGPGHIFLLHKQIITGAKIRKNPQVKWFWNEIGQLMSKRDFTKTKIIIGGSNFTIYPSGVELMSDIAEIIKPNKVGVTFLPMRRDLSSFDKDLIASLFTSLDAYMTHFRLTDTYEDDST